MDVEGAHRDVDGEQLEDPAGALEQDRPRGRGRRLHHRQPAARHPEQATDRPRVVEPHALAPPRAQHRRGEQPDSERGHHEEARHRPVRDLGRHEHVAHEQQRRNHVEEPVCEHRADESGARAPAMRGEAPP
jgi:hypothetical protein